MEGLKEPPVSHKGKEKGSKGEGVKSTIDPCEIECYMFHYVTST